MMRPLVALILLASFVTPAAAERGRRRGHRPPRPPQLEPLVDFGVLQRVTADGESAFDGDVNEQRCVQTVFQGGMRFDAGASIRACESAYDGDENELACLAVAVASWQEPSAAIAACESGFDGDVAELACTRTMTQSWLPATAVAACESAFDGDANEQACLTTLVGTRYDVHQLVSYCEGAYDGDANELWCVGQFR